MGISGEPSLTFLISEILILQGDATPHVQQKKAMLEKEGVVFVDTKVAPKAVLTADELSKLAGAV